MSAESTPPSLMYRQVSVATSDIKGAGTDANVSMLMFGATGNSGPHKLESNKVGSGVGGLV